MAGHPFRAGGVYPPALPRSRRGACSAFLILAAIALEAPPAAAQEDVAADSIAADSSQPRIRFEYMVLPASLGSAAGLALGAIGGVQLGWGGGDDPGAASALLFGMIGSALGTAAGVELGSTGRANFDIALTSAATGILVGGFSAWALASALDSDGAAFVGFAIGQGAFAALMTALVENT